MTDDKNTRYRVVRGELERAYRLMKRQGRRDDFEQLVGIVADAYPDIEACLTVISAWILGA